MVHAMSELRERRRSLWANAISLVGAGLAVVALILIGVSLVLEIGLGKASPYIGILTYLVYPGILLVGLVTIPAGYLWTRWRLRRRGLVSFPPLPVVDLNARRTQAGIAFFGVSTVGLLTLLSVIAYRGYEFTDSTAFCGQACHTVMKPAYTTYLQSPHARVSCAECHVGPGASWYVKSKLSGVRQVLAVWQDTFPRPLPTPIENLRPARETCERCHWPEKFFGDRLKTIPRFASDERNSPRTLTLLLRVGGGGVEGRAPGGIHWHMDVGSDIEYIARDPGRQEIIWVRQKHSDGRVTDYTAPGVRLSGEEIARLPRRSMDCMDCHNRPTHVYRSPDRAVNDALAVGRISRDLPFIKRIAVEALVQPYADGESARSGIASRIERFFRERYPAVVAGQPQAVTRAVAEVQRIYASNFFPEMRADWRAYPDNIGHLNFPGCLRCHDGRLADARGRQVSTDCAACHRITAQARPEGVQAAGGGRAAGFIHPILLQGRHAQLRCSACHTGGPLPEGTCADCHRLQASLYEGKFEPTLGIKAAPNVMAGKIDCEGCHKLEKPASRAVIRSTCAQCHDAAYAQLFDAWVGQVDEARAAAAQALRAVSQGMESARPRRGAPPAGEKRLEDLQRAFDQVSRARGLHNPDLAEAIYRQIGEQARGLGQSQASLPRDQASR